MISEGIPTSPNCVREAIGTVDAAVFVCLPVEIKFLLSATDGEAGALMSKAPSFVFELMTCNGGNILFHHFKNFIVSESGVSIRSNCFHQVIEIVIYRILFLPKEST